MVNNIKGDEFINLKFIQKIVVLFSVLLSVLSIGIFASIPNLSSPPIDGVAICECCGRNLQDGEYNSILCDEKKSICLSTSTIICNDCWNSEPYNCFKKEVDFDIIENGRHLENLHLNKSECVKCGEGTDSQGRSYVLIIRIHKRNWSKEVDTNKFKSEYIFRLYRAYGTPRQQKNNENREYYVGNGKWKKQNQMKDDENEFSHFPVPNGWIP